MLGLMLGNHPESVMMGEVVNFIEKGPYVDLRCGSTTNCPLMKLLLQHPYIDWYEIISQFEGKKVLIDSSKSFYWWNKIIHTIDDPRYDIRSLLLFKDPARQIGSITKHRSRIGKGTLEECKSYGKLQLIKQIESLLRLYKKIPTLVITYKELATDAEVVIKRICEYAEIPYRVGMSRFWENIHSHNIGGNRGARYSMGQVDLSNDSHSQHYKKHLREVFLDNSYRNYLSEEDLDKIFSDPEIIEVVQRLSEYSGVEFAKLMEP